MNYTFLEKKMYYFTYRLMGKSSDKDLVMSAIKID